MSQLRRALLVTCLLLPMFPAGSVLGAKNASTANAKPPKMLTLSVPEKPTSAKGMFNWIIIVFKSAAQAQKQLTLAQMTTPKSPNATAAALISTAGRIMASPATVQRSGRLIRREAKSRKSSIAIDSSGHVVHGKMNSTGAAIGFDSSHGFDKGSRTGGWESGSASLEKRVINDCTEEITYNPDGQAFSLGFFVTLLAMVVGAFGLGCAPFLRKTFDAGSCRVSVWALIMLLFIIIFLGIKIGGQSNFVKLYRDDLTKPSFECPCTAVCLNPDTEGVEGDCTDAVGNAGKICYQMVGRGDTCYDYNENCPNSLPSCTDEQEDELETYWGGTFWLDDLEFYHILSLLCAVFTMIIGLIMVLMYNKNGARTAFEIIAPLMLLGLGGCTVWELLLADLAGAPMGPSFTSLAISCPETDMYKETYRAKLLNSWGTLLLVVGVWLLSLEPALIGNEKPALRQLPYALCATPYSIGFLLIAFISFVATFSGVLVGTAEKLKDIEMDPNGYKSYGTSLGFCYTWSLVSLAFGYGLDLFLRNGHADKPATLGPACYLTQAALVLATVAGVLFEVLVLLFWLVAWLFGALCNGADASKLGEKVDSKKCETLDEIYNTTFNAMCFLTPMSLVFCMCACVRYWGHWSVVVKEDALTNGASESTPLAAAPAPTQANAANASDADEG